MARHIYDLRRNGIVEFSDALDAAALEAFCLHARALAEFLWRDRRSGRVRQSDSLAVDWFESDTWRPEAEPKVIADTRKRTGWGIAHISYDRLTPTTDWDHGEIFHQVASRMALFAEDVACDRVSRGFREQVLSLNIDLRVHKSRTHHGNVIEPNTGDGPVATPGNASTWLIGAGPM